MTMSMIVVDRTANSKNRIPEFKLKLVLEIESILNLTKNYGTRD